MRRLRGGLGLIKILIILRRGRVGMLWMILVKIDPFDDAGYHEGND
jgi:hypothetical protein